MRYLGYLWLVLRGLIEVFVVLALLHATQSRFETMVIGALIVIYASIVGTYKVLGRSQLHISHKQLELFLQLGSLLKHPNLEIYSMALKEEAEDIEKQQSQYWLSGMFNWVIGLIGTLALLVTALGS